MNTKALLGSGWDRIERRRWSGSGEELPIAPHQPEPGQGGNLQTTGATDATRNRAWELWALMYERGGLFYRDDITRRIMLDDMSVAEVEAEARAKVIKLERRATEPIPNWAGGLQEEVRQVHAQALQAVGWIALAVARGGNAPEMTDVLSALLAAMNRIVEAAQGEFDRLQRRIDELEEVKWWQKVFREFGDLFRAMGEGVQRALEPVGGPGGLGGGLMLLIAALLGGYALTRR